MTIQEIKKYPMTYEDKTKGPAHESLLRSFQMLQKVKEMLKRNDSAETVLEFIEECYYSN